MSDKKDAKTHGIDKYREFDPTEDPAGQLESVYAEWADGYDHDNDHKLGTVSQPTAVAMLDRHCSDRNAQIMDVGCGTGLVGHHLRLAGYKTYDGIDISLPMMAHAKSHGYRKLLSLTPGQPLPVSTDCYDATLCVGVFTHGHLGPEGFDELLRITRPGGLIGFTINEGVWAPQGFSAAIDRHVENNRWQILEQEKRYYMVKEKVRAWYVTAIKQS